jgi:hypothetical protein
MPSPVLGVTILSLVFYFIIFRLYLTFLEGVILILKHATLLASSSPQSALICADMGYREANIDLKVQQHLTASSQEHSVVLHAGFIMATDIGLFILASVKMIFLSSSLHQRNQGRNACA